MIQPENPEVPDFVQRIDYPNSGGPGDGPNPRIETGAVQFGDDWPGLFIRGDNAMALAQAISVVTERCAQLMGQGQHGDLALALITLSGYGDMIREEVIQ